MEIENVLKRLRIEKLNEMQSDALATIGSTDKNVVILSPTGSGKTLAYMLPLIGKLSVDSDNVQAIVITPGRELALQSDNVFKSMGLPLRSACCYGGRTAMEEHRTLKQLRPHIVFGTPGRLNDHLYKSNISEYGIRYVVIDEFDKCLEMGFHDEMKRLLKELPGLRQLVLLSATDADSIPDFVKLDDAVKLSYTDDEEQVSERVDLFQLRSETKDKLGALNRLLRYMGEESSIVFLNYRDSVERTADYLRREGFSVSCMHGGMEQKQREDALYKFTNGSANILVATDLASRGLDIPAVNNIIHYHLPLNEDGYVHRVGRTGRWDASGRAIFIMGPEEYKPEFINNDFVDFLAEDADGGLKELPSLDSLPRPAKPRMATLYIGKGKKDKISKGDIVGFLCRKGGLEQSEIGRIDVKDRYAYAAVVNRKVHEVIKNVQGEKIKGIRTIVELIK